MVGQLLKKLDDLGLTDDTLVIFTTDNGAEKFTWPDGGTSPFRGEKGLGWEGGFRVPFLMRWPGHIPEGKVVNGITAHEDVLPTVLAAAGEPDIVEKCKAGYDAGDTNYCVHLDGYDLLPYLTGSVEQSPRHDFFYYGETSLYAVRYRNWKVHFEIKDTWFAGQSKTPTVPQPVNLRADPFEQHMEAPAYPAYAVNKLWTVLPIAAMVQQHLGTFREFPPRQAVGKIDFDEMVASVMRAAASRQGN